MPAIAGLLIGAYQGIRGAQKHKNAESGLESYANGFQPNSGITGLYDKALAKYSANPYTGTAYQQQTNQIGRNLASGISAANNKRMGLGAIAGLTQQANDASGRAVVNAEGVENQNFGRLTQTAAMKAAEQQKKFDMIYNLKAQKAGQAASLENTGISNAFNGIGNLSALYGSEGEYDGLHGMIQNYRTNKAAARTIGMGRLQANPTLNSYR